MDNSLLHSKERNSTQNKKTTGKNQTVNFTIDWEDYYHALVPFEDWFKYKDRIEEPTYWLLDTLDKFKVKAHWYILGALIEKHSNLVWEIVRRGHTVGSHGWYHGHNEKEGNLLDLECKRRLKSLVGHCEGFRSPYWDTTPRPGYSGGAYFRLLPLALVRSETKRTGQFWIHPHDLDEGQPRIKGGPFWRYMGLKGARQKLVRLLQEIEWKS